jgi:hypothetical protein
MKTSVTLFSALRALEDRRVLVKLSLCDRHIDPDNVLPGDPASTDVEVSSRERIAAVSGNKDKHECASPN